MAPSASGRVNDYCEEESNEVDEGADKRGDLVKARRDSAAPIEFHPRCARVSLLPYTTRWPWGNAYRPIQRRFFVSMTRAAVPMHFVKSLDKLELLSKLVFW